MSFVNCFGNNPGFDGPVLDSPGSLEELLGYFKDSGPDIVWRGQANFMWPAFPTLYRRLRRFGLADCQISESAVGLAEARVIADAGSQGLLTNDGSILEFMARLQHHGGATRLLDVTTDHRVALYFACSGQSDMAGTVLCYRVNPENRIELGGHSKEAVPDWYDLLGLCDDCRLRLIMPGAYDRRIEAQHGAFLLAKLQGTLAEPNVYTKQSYDAEVTHVYVEPRLKHEVLDYLRDEGITEDTLFPSIEAFARSHSVSEPIQLA